LDHWEALDQGDNEEKSDQLDHLEIKDHLV